MKYFSINLILCFIFAILVNVLEEVLQTCDLRQNFVAKVVHKEQLIVLHHDHTFLEGIKHPPEVIPLIVYVFNSINMLVSYAIWYHDEGWDQDHQVNYCYANGHQSRERHLHIKFTVSKNDRWYNENPHYRSQESG